MNKQTSNGLRHFPWHRSTLVGRRKAPLRLKKIWGIPNRLEVASKVRDLVLFRATMAS